MDLFELTAKIILDTAGYIAGLDEAEQKTDEFQNSASGAGSATDAFGGSMGEAIGQLKSFVAGSADVAAMVKVGKAMWENAEATAAFGDQIDKQSQKLGISSDAYQRWSFILEHNGTSINIMTAAMRTLTNQAGKNSEAFGKLGISAKDLKKMNGEQLFEATINGLSAMSNESERAQMASELLGRSYQELLPTLNSGATGIEDLSKQYDRLGAKMTAAQVKQAAMYQDAKTDLDTAWTGFKNQLGSMTLPWMTDLVQWTANTLGDINTYNTQDNGTGDTLEEAQQVLDELIQKRQEYIDLTGDAAAADMVYNQQIKEQETHIANLTAEIEADAQARADAEAAAKAEIAANLAELALSYQDTYDAINKSVSGYFDTFEKAGEVQDQSIQNMTDNLQSQIEFNENFAANMQTIGQYAEETGINFESLNTAIAEMGKDGAGYAQAIADAIEAGDADAVNDLVAAYESLQDSQNMLTGMLTDSIGAWDALYDAANGDIEAIKTAFESIGKLPPQHLEVIVQGTGDFDALRAKGLVAGGIDYVPYHNALYMLHEGERVLTKEENRDYTKHGAGSSAKGVTINQYINSIPQTPADIAAATEAYFEQARWMM